MSNFRPAQSDNNFQHQNDLRNPSIAISRRLSFHADQNDAHWQSNTEELNLNVACQVASFEQPNI